MSNDGPVYAALITATAALAVSIVAVLSGFLSDRRLRRRKLYGEAYQSAMAWLEMVGRVRRRGADEKSRSELIERFHVLQEDLLYHQGWIGSESIYMQRSYKLFVSKVKTQSRNMINDAWSAPAMPTPSASLKGSQFPNVDDAAARFLSDVRCHLSPLLILKVVPSWRYWKA